MNNTEDIWGLMARCAFNEATNEERDLLQQYLHENPHLQQQYAWLLQILESKQEFDSQHKEPEIRTVQRILEKASREQEHNVLRIRKIRAKRVWAAAASVLIIIGLGYFLKLGSGEREPITRPIVTNAAPMTDPVMLADGSKVWLNSDSKLFFESDFNGATREVRLVGEAFFDIVRDTLRPFIVHVNELNINVLGTAFNVKSYEEDTEIQTTLYRGLIKVAKDKDDRFHPIMMYPNQKIVIPKKVLTKEYISVLNNVDVISLISVDSTIQEEERVETAWIYGRIDFKSESLEQIARKMARRYKVKFVFEDDAVKQLSFTGSFKNESLEAALRALQMAKPFSYKIKADEVIISSR